MFSPSLWFLSLAVSAGCATVVPSGFAAVLVTPRGGVQPQRLGEGVHLLPPLTGVDLYDLRGQERDADLIAITADGAPVQARTSLVTYSLVGDELARLDREVGPDYYNVIVRPIVGSTVRRIIAAYAASQLDSATIRAAQRAITKAAAAQMRPYHIILDSVDLRTLAVLFSSDAYRHLVESGVLEQEVLAKPHKLEVARRRGDALREAARAIAAAHARVAPTLTPEALREAAQHAEDKLLTSPSTTVLVGDSRHPLTLEVLP